MRPEEGNLSLELCVIGRDWPHDFAFSLENFGKIATFYEKKCKFSRVVSRVKFFFFPSESSDVGGLSRPFRLFHDWAES